MFHILPLIFINVPTYQAIQEDEISILIPCLLAHNTRLISVSEQNRDVIILWTGTRLIWYQRVGLHEQYPGFDLIWNIILIICVQLYLDFSQSYLSNKLLLQTNCSKIQIRCYKYPSFHWSTPVHQNQEKGFSRFLKP